MNALFVVQHLVHRPIAGVRNWVPSPVRVYQHYRGYWGHPAGQNVVAWVRAELLDFLPGKQPFVVVAVVVAVISVGRQFVDIGDHSLKVCNGIQ